jgi:hypothetical protein
VAIGPWRGGAEARTPAGEVRWRRRDLTHLHGVAALPDGGVMVTQDRGPAHILGLTGGTRRTVPAGRFVAAGANGALLVQHGHEVVYFGTRAEPERWRHPMASFAVLDAALTDDDVLLAEADGRLTCLAATAETRWRLGDAAWRFIQVHTDPHRPGWLAVRWPVGRNERPQLVHVAPDGSPGVVSELPVPGELGFVDNGHHLITSAGQVRSTQDGQPVADLSAMGDGG